MMFDAEYLSREFDSALVYERYIETGKPHQQEGWAGVYERTGLAAGQRDLLSGFTREMRVLVLSGMWCGDCVQQCPLMQRIAEGSEKIVLRFVDRDEHADLAGRVRINGGLRVPTVLFMAEDCEFVGVYGDRTLSRYRSVAERQTGAACELPGAVAPQGELDATLADWASEFERVQLLLRLSPRLREKHGD